MRIISWKKLAIAREEGWYQQTFELSNGARVTPPSRVGVIRREWNIHADRDRERSWFVEWGGM
jgi:hypothetical protein